MVDRGAKAEGAEQSAIIAYLAKQFGKGSPVAMNTAPQAELIVVLGFSTVESAAIVAYRADKGTFKDWRDVVKVPGVDTLKVENQKEKMAF